MELTFTVSGRSLFHTRKARLKEEHLEARICDVISCTKMKFENSNKTSSSLLYALYFYKVLQFQVTYIWRRNAKQPLKWNILKRGFVASSVATSQKRNLRIQIWQVLQFHMHCIFAKYHSFRLHTSKEKHLGVWFNLGLKKDMKHIRSICRFVGMLVSTVFRVLFLVF